MEAVVKSKNLRRAESMRTSHQFCWPGICLVMLAAMMSALVGCGGSTSQTSSSGQVSGNWQFALTPPSDNSFSGGLQGGFLLQQGSSINGQVGFSISLPSSNGGAPVVCNSGTASVTGNLSGQTVNLTASIGTLDQNGNPATQTFTLSGQLSSNGSTIPTGSYSTTAGYYLNTAGQLAACGTAESGVQWSAFLVPPITGAFQGFFHSLGGAAGLANQDFPVSGSLSQGTNIGAVSATVTGNFAFPAATYPCLSAASLTGQISGTSVVLQITTSSGSNAGQIGGLGNGAGTTYAVSYDNTSGGYVLQNPLGVSAPGYALNTKNCPGSGLNSVTSGDVGNICWAFGGGTGCTQPITFSPISLVFPSQVLGSAATTQTVTLANTTSSPLSTSLSFADNTGNSLFYGTGDDFNGLSTFTVLSTGQQNDCTTIAPLGSSFSLASSCTITVQFAPQESCPWLLPTSSGADLPSPSLCPSTLPASLTVSTNASADGDNTFVVPVSGTGTSALLPSTPELDFSAEDVGETSPAQTLTFTNQSSFPVQILAGTNSCASVKQQLLPHFVSDEVAGIQVVKAGPGANFPILPALSDPNQSSPNTITYYCDLDSATNLEPNFVVQPGSGSESCAGTTLAPGASCALQISFAPQPSTWNVAGSTGLAYFLELNTLWCDPNTNPAPGSSNPCELDSGRFPVELRTNSASTLRMSVAGLNFGTQSKGTTSGPMTVTLTNDPADNTTVTFTGKSLPGSNYTESDLCPLTLAPGDSCTLNFTFTPGSAGFQTSVFTLAFNAAGPSGNQNGLVQHVYLRGTGQ